MRWARCIFCPVNIFSNALRRDAKPPKPCRANKSPALFVNFTPIRAGLRDRILRYREEPEGNYILSYEPAGQRTIFVETGSGKVAEITIPLPTLILFGHKNEFYLWAAKGKKVSPNTKLALAPLPNIGGNLSGKICFGSNEVPEAKVENLDTIWNLIFNTPFNGDHSTKKCVSAPDDVRKLLVKSG